ncbi:MAG TPA: T9SS type A sorting domain-containing protein, partial [Catalimonadaceae bacterium]|nr:T9SS type A sorting domain-containing protein [Catalimonadaceae bacterium]
NTSTTIRAMATAPGANNSAVAVAYISIGPGREAVDNSLDESSLESDVHVFPNPSSSGRFHIQLPENVDSIELFTVLSLDGKILWTASPSGQTELEIDLSDRPSGLYLLKFHDGTSVKTVRLSKF